MFGLLKVITVASLAGVSLIVARLFGPDGSGEFTLVSTLLLFLLTTSLLGIDTGVTWMVSSGRWRAPDALRTTRLGALALGIAGAAAGVGLYALGSSSVFGEIRWALIVPALASLPFALLWTYASGVALGTDRYEPAVAMPAAQAFAYVAGVGLLGALFGLEGAVFGLLVGHVAAAAIAMAWNRRVDRASTSPPKTDFASLTKAARFGLKLWVPTVLSILQLRFDLFLLGAYFNHAEVGYYAVAIAITSTLPILPAALGSVLFPRVAALSAAGEVGAAWRERTETKTLRHTTLVLSVGAVVLAAFLLAMLKPLWGERFAPALAPGLILLPGAIALGYATIIYAALAGRGRPDYALRASLIVTPPTLVLYLVLIPAYGATGAALGSALGYATSAALAFLFLHAETGRALLPQLIPGRNELMDYLRRSPLRRSPR